MTWFRFPIKYLFILDYDRDVSIYVFDGRSFFNKRENIRYFDSDDTFESFI